MDTTNINPTDLAVLAIVLLSALLAFARGFIREVLSVAAWVGAAFAAIWAFPHVQPVARDFIAMELAANAAAAVGVFIVALILLSLVFGRLGRRVRGSSLSAVDRSLGFLFGVARGAILVCLAYLMVTWIYPADQQPEWLRSARTMPVIRSGAEKLRRLIPDETGSRAGIEGGQAADAARVRANRTMQEETLRRLSTPTTGPATDPARRPAKTDAPTSEPGYNQQERSQLRGLFERSTNAN